LGFLRLSGLSGFPRLLGFVRLLGLSGFLGLGG
jgi:hypothetical protein